MAFLCSSLMMASCCWCCRTLSFIVLFANQEERGIGQSKNKGGLRKVRAAGNFQQRAAEKEMAYQEGTDKADRDEKQKLLLVRDEQSANRYDPRAVANP